MVDEMNKTLSGAKKRTKSQKLILSSLVFNAVAIVSALILVSSHSERMEIFRDLEDLKNDLAIAKVQLTDIKREMRSNSFLVDSIVISDSIKNLNLRRNLIDKNQQYDSTGKVSTSSYLTHKLIDKKLSYNKN